MVARTSLKRGVGFVHFLKRGAVLLAIAALLDMLVWQVVPFTAVDVLYLIGVSLPLTYLSLRLPRVLGWMSAIGIFVAAEAMRRLFGYTDYPTTITLMGELYVTPTQPTSILQHWIVDGWFPMLPWLGFALFGAQWEYARRPGSNDRNRRTLLIGMALVDAGWIWWRLVPAGMLTRGDYSEVFYPATLPFIATAIGVVLVLFGIVDRFGGNVCWQPFRVLGESALAMYVLHFIVIRFVLAEIFEDETLGSFAVLYALMLAILGVCGIALRSLKGVWPRLPFPLNVLLGG